MLTALSCMTHVPALAERCAAASSFGALFAILENFCNMAGFRWFSLYYRSDGGTADSLTNFTLPNLSRWMFDQFGGSSPIGVAADGCATSVAWHEIAGAISLTSRQSKVLEEFERHGIRHGVTVPVRVPGDRGALISFATDDPARLSQDARYAAELLASHVFQAARRIENRDGNRKRLGKGMLTGRQVECLKLRAPKSG